MYPGAFLNIDHPEQMKPYLFEGFDPSLRDERGDDALIIIGANGSSREHVVQAMKAWGVQGVVGKSFARILRRNCVNLGLPVLECPDAAEAARPGSRVRVDTCTGVADVDGWTFQSQPLPELVLELQATGGLVPWACERLQA